MEGTRDRIVRILQKDGTATVDSLSKALQLAPATIRRHLDILQRDNLVTFTQVRKPTGRPEYSFSLTETGYEALPKGYDVLLMDLVRELTELAADEIAGKTGAELLTLLLIRMGEREAATSSRGKGDVEETLTRVLEERNLAPVVEQDEEGLHITVTNCPFRSVAKSEEAVCVFHKSLISAIVGSEVKQKADIARGGRHCSYLIPL